MFTREGARPEVGLGGTCPDCGHEASGVRPARWVNRRRVKAGEAPIYAVCDAVVAEHGWGDDETCECTSASHAAVLR